MLYVTLITGEGRFTLATSFLQLRNSYILREMCQGKQQLIFYSLCHSSDILSTISFILYLAWIKGCFNIM